VTSEVGRQRARELGVPFGGGPCGPLNALTDVPGVQVGYTTLIEGDGPLVVGAGPVRTGVTAILPQGRAGVGSALPAGWFALNGNGEMTGTTWIDEVGALSGPVLITNTHAVGPCSAGVVRWTVDNFPELAEQWLLPVVAETWDGYLNDINGAHVTADSAIQAIDIATGGLPEEGAVGGGTGMTCYGFKGGSGTSSRVVEYGDERYTVGVFVQANFGSRAELTVAGIPVGAVLVDDSDTSAQTSAPPVAGSVIAVVATDAPLLPGQCKAMARRVPLGLARTGTSGSHFSGDIFLAFSTANAGALGSALSPDDAVAPQVDYGNLRFVSWGSIDPFYTATVHATEEAVLNALVAGRTMVGRDGNSSPGLPHDELRRLMRRTHPEE
jgi:D-aminopeptidase